MKNRFVKITLTLSMLLVMAVPTQAFGAEKCNLNTFKPDNNNFSNIYAQFSKTPLTKAKESCTDAAAVKSNQQILNLLSKCDFNGSKNLMGTNKPKAINRDNCTKVAVSNKDNCTKVDVSNKDNCTKPSLPNKNNSTKPEVKDPVKPTAPQLPVSPTQPESKDEPKVEVPSNNALGAYEQQVVDLVNKERAAAGLPALKANTKLAGVAELKAEDMRDKNYFSHTSPTYGSPFDMMKQHGVTYTAAGENIAKGQKTPDAVMNGWMNSQGHKDNILNSSFTEIGVGYVTDSNGTTYWVQMFIRP